jgi:hypothetical protein
MSCLTTGPAMGTAFVVHVIEALALLSCHHLGSKHPWVHQASCLHCMKLFGGCVPADMLCKVAELVYHVLHCAVLFSITHTGDGELEESVAGRWRRWGWRWLGEVGGCASGAQLAKCKACLAWALDLRSGVRLLKSSSRKPLMQVQYRSHGTLNC